MTYSLGMGWKEEALVLYAGPCTSITYTWLQLQVTGHVGLPRNTVARFLKEAGVVRTRSGRASAKTKRACYRHPPKTCPVCKTEFVPTARQQRFCVACNVPEDYRLLKVHGITAADVRALRALQDEKCGICGTNLDDFPPSQVHVDHNHETNTIRGITCLTCNLRLATLENLKWREQAECYLLLAKERGIEPRCPCRNTRRRSAT